MCVRNTGQVMDGMNKKSDKSQPEKSGADDARERQRLIGRRLQTFFDDTIQEGVPEEFSKLLDQLDKAERKRAGSANSDDGAKDGDDAKASAANSGSASRKPGGSR